MIQKQTVPCLPKNKLLYRKKRTRSTNKALMNVYAGWLSGEAMLVPPTDTPPKLQCMSTTATMSGNLRKLMVSCRSVSCCGVVLVAWLSMFLYARSGVCCLLFCDFVSMTFFLHKGLTRRRETFVCRSAGGGLEKS